MHHPRAGRAGLARSAQPAGVDGAIDLEAEAGAYTITFAHGPGEVRFIGGDLYLAQGDEAPKPWVHSQRTAEQGPWVDLLPYSADPVALIDAAAAVELAGDDAGERDLESTGEAVHCRQGPGEGEADVEVTACVDDAGVLRRVEVDGPEGGSRSVAYLELGLTSTCSPRRQTRRRRSTAERCGSPPAR